jgi:hypothetical protein
LANNKTSSTKTSLPVPIIDRPAHLAYQ